jgi:hypothetical protein
MTHHATPLRTTGLLLILAVAASGSTPQISAIRPVGAQRGTEVEVTISGARLGDAQEIVWYRKGIETLGITKVDDNSVKAKLKIGADSLPGLYDLRVRAATGLSDLRTFSVGALPETSEVEPNNDFATPQKVPFGSVVNGVAENEDIDYFAIDAKKGQRISVEVEGFRLGLTRFDPYVAILDAKRFELASSDDRSLVWQDGALSVLAPEDGTYTLAVRESAYAGNGGCLYRLHVGPFPRPLATIPAGGKPGEKLSVTWIGDPTGAKTTEVTLPAEAGTEFGVHAQDDQGIAPYPNMMRASDLANQVEKEPNDDQATATAVTAPGAFHGVIEKADDTDYFTFKATKGQAFDIQCYARRLRSPLDSVMHVAHKGGKYLAGADDSAGPDSLLRFTAPEDGEYVVWVHDHLKKGDPTAFYRIEMNPVVAKLTMNLVTEQIPLGTGIIAASVPKGNRQALLMYASRIDWGGDLKIEVPGLPTGVTATSDVMPASQPVVPVLFEAAADAPVAGTLTRPVGAPIDPNIKVASQEFGTTNVLVLGDNNVSVWQRTVDRMAVAVTEECPYRIDVIEPKVPLVRGGQMGLKVKATRKEGFKAAIAVSLPWLPPDVGASGGIVIPEGQDEAVIPMNAGGNAELRSWKLVVNGSSTIPTGPVMVSSQLFSLAIAPPFVGLAFQNTTVEQGKEADLLVKVSKLVDYPGEATVTLVGLPNKAVTEVKKITQETPEVIFHITTAPETPAGNHANLFCQVVVTKDGEPITHNIGTGALRVDVPIAPKAAVAEAPKPAEAAPAKPAEAPPKPLTRLEKLRLEQQEKAKAAASGAKS